MQNREKVKQGFNRLSPFYDAAAYVFFGRALWRAQSYFIPSLEHVNTALIIGGGTGRILEEMLEHNIADNYYYLDISDQMVERAKKRVQSKFSSKASSVTFHAGSIHDVPSSFTCDLIITPFLLDMIDKEELTGEMKMMDQRLEQGGKWLFTDFNYPARKGFASFFSRPLISFLYFSFRVFTGVKNRSLAHFRARFTALGYELKREKYFLGELLVTQLWSKQ